MKDFLKSFAFKVLGVIALILVGVMIYGASTGGLATIPATIAGAIITPLQSAVTSVSDGISGFFGQFGSSKEKLIAEGKLVQPGWYATMSQGDSTEQEKCNIVRALHRLQAE